MQVAFSLPKLKVLRGVVENEVRSYHNWVASAVERGAEPYGETGLTGHAYAQKLVGEMRVLQEIYATLNGAVMEAEKMAKAGVQG